MMRRALIGLAIAASTAGGVSAQAGPVSYEVTFPNAEHHEAEVAVTFPGLARGAPLTAWMSRSSPGRYAVHEFSKNVYNLRATDGRGRPLAVEPATPYSWTVAGHDGTVTIRYTLFGDRGDGTYAQIDRVHAHLNAPAALLWAKGLESRPARVRFPSLPAGWRVATQLKPTADPASFTAPDLQYLLDSPITLGALDIRSWLVTNGDRTDTIRVAMNHLGTSAEVDRYVEMARKVVQEQAGVFGELPRFDFGTYTFLAVYLPWGSGDGMEHRNSTSLTGTRPLATGLAGSLGTVSHEFFHAWNVERIRPRSLEPFDFTAANLSGELWLAEGFTNYYGTLTLRRAGLRDDAELARSLGGAVNEVINRPGRRFHSAVGMSRQAPFTDAAVSIDPQNRSNRFISYYTYGQAIATGLDLTLRSRFPDVTLDDFMGAMWRKFGKTGKPYTMDDVRVTLGEMTRDRAFADDYVRRYIAGQEVPDYAALFARVGFLFRLARPEAAWLGDVSFDDRSGSLTISASTLVGQPVYRAGLDRGDVIRTIGGMPAGSRAELDSLLARHRPGDILAVAFESRGQSLTGQIILEADPRMELVPAEAAGAALTPGVQEARRRWLASRAGTQGAPR
jgi:predicted metalloprotease with PDZ domain